jgi:hypothetical protein
MFRPNDAKFFVHEDEEALTLQIELLNDCAVTLVVWKNGDDPGVGIWHGNWEQHFNSPIWGRFDLKLFREWLAIATGEKNDVPVPLGLLEFPLEERLRLGITKRKDDNVVAFEPKNSPDGAA